MLDKIYRLCYNVSMSKNTTHTTTTKPSALDSFSLSFEYDMSWSDVKKHTKGRTL